MNKYQAALDYIKGYVNSKDTNLYVNEYFNKYCEVLQELINKQDEEKIGLDLLDKVFNGLMYGIYVKIEDCSVRSRFINYISAKHGIITDWDEQLELNDYGKTWALTKEELENGTRGKE